MNIGILGSGEVAKSLAAGFIGRGDAVMLGTRDPDKLAADVQEGVRVGSFAQAAQFDEVVVVATNGTAVEDALELAGADNFNSKVVIDVTNPLDSSTGKLRLTWGFDDSNGERVQQALPAAKVVKAFNTVGHALFVHPDLPGGPPSMFVAGDDDGAKQTVAKILADFGWECIDAGDIESSRYLEPMCVLWIDYGLRTQNWTHAFKLLHR